MPAGVALKGAVLLGKALKGSKALKPILGSGAQKIARGYKTGGVKRAAQVARSGAKRYAGRMSRATNEAVAEANRLQYIASLEPGTLSTRMSGVNAQQIAQAQQLVADPTRIKAAGRAAKNLATNPAVAMNALFMAPMAIPMVAGAAGTGGGQQPMDYADPNYDNLSGYTNSGMQGLDMDMQMMDYQPGAYSNVGSYEQAAINRGY